MSGKDLVGIIADSHDNRRTITRAVELFNRHGVGRVFHAGDFVAPFTSMDFSKLNCEMTMVFGNNDGEKVGLYHSFRRLGTIGVGPVKGEYHCKRFILMHEPNCLDELAAGGQADFIIYGHTHDLDIRQGKTMIINPGETGGWLRGKATVALLDVNTMEVSVEEIG